MLVKCQEETEQDQEVRDLEQVEVWVKAALAGAIIAVTFRKIINKEAYRGKDV